VARVGGCGELVFSDLDAFAKFRKVTIIFMSVFPSAWKSSAPTGHIFMEFKFFFENLSRKFQFHYNLRRITGSFHEDRRTVMNIRQLILLRMRNSSRGICRGNQNTHFIVYIFSPSENRDVYDICGKLWQTQTEDGDR
jgi:hypothetical protein